MNPITVTLQLQAANASLLATSQTPVSGTALTLTGSQPDVARRILLTYGNEAAQRTLVLTGTNRYGNTISETLTVPSGGAGTVYTQRDFLTVTSALPLGGGWSAAVTLGTTTIGSTQWFLREWMGVGKIGARLYIAPSAVVSASIELTWDDPNASQSDTVYPSTPEPQSFIPPVATPHPLFTGVSVTTIGVIDIPCFAFRLTVVSGNSAATMQAIETTIPAKDIF